MSLTSFLKNPDLRERFRAELTVLPLGAAKELLAPPLSQNYSLVGTAFDYLLRFYVERLNPKCVTRDWIADQGALCDIEFEDRSVDLPEILTRCKQAHAEFLKTGVVDDALLRAVVCLAQLDVVSRRGLLHGEDDAYFRTIGKIDPADVRDLR